MQSYRALWCFFYFLLVFLRRFHQYRTEMFLGRYHTLDLLDRLLNSMFEILFSNLNIFLIKKIRLR